MFKKRHSYRPGNSKGLSSVSGARILRTKDVPNVPITRETTGEVWEYGQEFGSQSW